MTIQSIRDASAITRLRHPAALVVVALLATAFGGRPGQASTLPASRVGDVDGDGRLTINDARLALLDALGVRALPADRRVVAALGGTRPTRTTAVSILRAALGLEALPWLRGSDYLDGATMTPDGTLFYTDYSGRTVVTAMTDGAFGVYLKTPGDPAATRLKPDAHLLLTQFSGSLLDISPDRVVTMLASAPMDGALGRPYGLALADDGSIYFTGQGSGKVYLLPPGGVPRTVVTGLTVATGVALSPDSHLLVADAAAGKVWDYPLGPDGMPTGPRRLRAAGPQLNDIRLDPDGNLWGAGISDGRLYVFAPDGTLLRRFTTGAGRCTSLAFGPAGSHAVYVTTSQPGTVAILRLSAGDPLAAAMR